MKAFLFIFTLIFGIQLLSAQEFKKTETYKVAVSAFVDDKEVTPYNASIVKSDDPECVLTSFRIQSPSRVSDISVESLDNPNLLNLQQIIKMVISYEEPKPYSISKYVLVTIDGSYIDLPVIVNMEANMPRTETIYSFPNQAFGENNKIIKLEITYDEQRAIESIDVVKTFVWNDDIHGNSAKISGLY